MALLELLLKSRAGLLTTRSINASSSSSPVTPYSRSYTLSFFPDLRLHSDPANVFPVAFLLRSSETAPPKRLI